MYRENWEVLTGHEEYAISDQGEVQNLKTRHILATRSNAQGVVMVNIKDRGGMMVTRAVGQLVAKMFLPPPPEEYDSVINLNGDRSDCRAENLAWRPRWFAIQYHQQFAWPALRFVHPIYCADTDEIFEDCLEPAVKYGLLQKDIFNDVVNQRGVWPLHFTFLVHKD